jgi:adenine-specific DNA-methyltransferase
MEIYTKLETLLKEEPNFISDEGKLKKWVVINKAQNFDPELVKMLIKDKKIKELFFINVNEVLVFNHNLFIQFLEQKNYLNDSYTKYRNMVGLTTGGSYFKQRNEVSLVWPFKDCILEGGQNSEEQKREEIFFNEIIAQDEITQLLEPKVITKPKSFNLSGEQQFVKFNRDTELNKKRGLQYDTITDNLIIKGNNLLALHSLKSEFSAKVDLIYIDPPYNTGGTGDTFQYNNNFKRSTWLTFMQNRLEAAKTLLKKNGVIIVAIDENEQVHLGVLLNDLFPDSEVHCITIVHNPRGVQGTNFSYTHEYAFFIIPKGIKSISNQIIEKSEIKFRGLRDNGGESLRSDAKNCFYPFIVNPKNDEIIGFGEVEPDDFHSGQRTIEKDGKIYVYPIDNDGIERKWRYAKQSAGKVLHLMRAKKVNGEYDIQLGKDFRQYKTVWSGARYDANEYGTKLIKGLVPNSKFSFPKSLWNVYDCLYAAVGNNPNAIILDYHAGSGTTGHAVLEMNKRDNGKRRFILCEQMDYIETETNIRIKNVIVNGKLNESFAYFELKKFNQDFIKKIETAKDTDGLLQIWELMKSKSFLNYNVDLKKHEEFIEDFKELNFKEQKEHLCSLLDKNHLYVNLSSLDDNDFNCKEEEKYLTQDFYQSKKK